MKWYSYGWSVNNTVYDRPIDDVFYRKQNISKIHSHIHKNEIWMPLRIGNDIICFSYNICAHCTQLFFFPQFPIPHDLKSERTNKQKRNRINVITLMCLTRILIPLNFILLRHCIYFCFVWFLRSPFQFQWNYVSDATRKIKIRITICFRYRNYDFH